MQAKVDVKTAAGLLDVSERYIRKAVAGGIYSASMAPSVGGSGGMSYEIPVSELPIEAQLKWAASFKREVTDTEFDWVGYQHKYGKEGIQKVMDRLQAVQLMEAFKKSGQKGVCDKRQEVADSLGISAVRMAQLERAYEKKGVAGLADGVTRSDKGSPRTLCLMAQDVVLSEYCVSSRPQNRSVYRTLVRIGKEIGADACAVCPYNDSFYRAQLLNEGHEIPEKCELEGKEGLVVPTHHGTVDRFIASIPQGVKDMGRYGARYWEANNMPKAIREKPDKANSVWFGDHHVFDLFVIGPEGKIARPWLTAWMDAKSNCIVGWAISLNPNSETVIESLVRGIAVTKDSVFWGAPEVIYIDNGKDYRCRRMEGESLKEVRLGNLGMDTSMEAPVLKALGINVVHAIPYRAWSKTIERVFGTIERGWIQGKAPGWCGNDSNERPESLNEDIRQGRLWTYEQFCDYFINIVLPEYHQQKGENGMAPIEIYMASEKARPDVIGWGTLAMTKKQNESRKVGTQGIRFSGRTFNHPDLIPYIGKWVTVLYNRKDDESLTVMAGNEFVCECFEADKLLLVGESEERLGRHMKLQQDAKAAAKRQISRVKVATERLRDIILETPDLTTRANLQQLAKENAYRMKKEALEHREESRVMKQRASGKDSALSRKFVELGLEMLERREAAQ